MTDFFCYFSYFTSDASGGPAGHGLLDSPDLRGHPLLPLPATAHRDVTVLRGPAGDVRAAAANHRAPSCARHRQPAGW